MTSFNGIFCFIPAKGTSTRLPNKNILDLRGKPLFTYAIDIAKKSNLFESNIVVSTESDAIISIAKTYDVHIEKRNPSLSQDPAGVADVLYRFLQINPSYQQFENVMIILPTAPLVVEDDLVTAYDLFLKQNHNYLMSVSETDHSAWRSLSISDNTIQPLFPEKIRKKSQELEPTYHINGAIIICKTSDFVKHKSYFGDRIGTYIMPRERSLDIDTLFDFKLAELFLDMRMKDLNL